MKEFTINSIKTCAVFVLAMLFTACATTLAPAYKQAIVDELVSTNSKLMEHFALHSFGTTKETFEQRKNTYGSLIGRLDGLAILARSRPIPDNKIIEKIAKFMDKNEIDILDGDNAPSAAALEKISAVVGKMRDTDIKQGVSAFEVKTFRGVVVIYLDQALTYESFLER